MSPDHLMMREDPSTFEVMDLHEYFQDFTNFIGIEIAIDLFLLGAPRCHLHHIVGGGGSCSWRGAKSRV